MSSGSTNIRLKNKASVSFGHEVYSGQALGAGEFQCVPQVAVVAVHYSDMRFLFSAFANLFKWILSPF